MDLLELVTYQSHVYHLAQSFNRFLVSRYYCKNYDIRTNPHLLNESCAKQQIHTYDVSEERASG